MKPITMAENECCAYSGGKCDGLTINDRGALVRFRPENNKCLLRDNEPCQHFELCVLPLRNIAKDEKLTKDYTDAFLSYQTFKKTSPEPA